MSYTITVTVDPVEQPPVANIRQFAPSHEATVECSCGWYDVVPREQARGVGQEHLSETHGQQP